MLEAQRFALENIYCAPGQDAQYSFKLIRVNKPNLPFKNWVDIYNTKKHLPNKTNFFHVFAIGQIPNQVLNLLSQKESWFKDTWIKVSDDMVSRNIIFQLYNQDGVMYPRQNLYYSFIDERSLLIAQEIPVAFKNVFNTESFEYLHLYSNAYFRSSMFATGNSNTGIDYRFQQVENNVQKVALQTFVTNSKLKGGDVFVYVNGMYSSDVTLDIPDYSYVEVVYDQSVISKEFFALEGLHTFDSIKDNRLKYVIHRDKIVDQIQYYDDTEVYVQDTTSYYTKGLYYYKHKDHSMRNITDKDFSLNSAYVNTTALKLGELTTPGFSSKQVVLYTRKSGRNMQLVYSSLKLHEFYKLPKATQFNVLIDNGHTADIFRAEQLENSSYFKVAEALSMNTVDKQLATDAIGYNGLTHYLADTPVPVVTGVVNVPPLYQNRSTVFEYDSNGLFIDKQTTSGPVYLSPNANSATVEFILGRTPDSFGRLYEPNETIPITNSFREYVVLSAYFTNTIRESNWEDITNTSRAVVSGNNLILNEGTGKKVKIVYLDEINVYDLEVDFTDGCFYFPLTQMEDKGTGVLNYPCDVPYLNISIFMNKRRLTMGVDWFINFPYVCITNKKYIDYTSATQKVHIRCSGVTLNTSEINKQEIRGFVNNGVLTRNKRFDIRDDKVYSVFIDGKLYNKTNVSYSEEDNTVRLTNPLNGLPYTVTDIFIPVKSLTGLDTLPIYRDNATRNKKVSDLYDVVFPEPSVSQLNAIGTPHFVYSPTISKIINDVITGVIPSSLYTTPYDNNTILSLLDNDYSHLLKLDPVKNGMQSVLVEIHPHLGNSVINLTLHQYRFVMNVIKFVTNNNPDKINTSGYLSIST